MGSPKKKNRKLFGKKFEKKYRCSAWYDFYGMAGGALNDR
jgi:hypothetical protein